MIKAAATLALLLAFAAAADARRSVLQGAKVKCAAGCLPGKCSANGKKCTACAAGYVLKPSSGQCVCPDGTGSWANQTYGPIAGWPAAAPNCGTLPAEACVCMPCPDGFVQTGAGSIPDAVCQPVPVDCVATYAECPAASCLPTLNITAARLTIITQALHGGKDCPETITRECSYAPLVECPSSTTCQTNTCEADGTCSATFNTGTACSTAEGAAGTCGSDGTCVASDVDCVAAWVPSTECAQLGASCSGTMHEIYSVVTPAAGNGLPCPDGSTPPFVYEHIGQVRVTFALL